MKRFKLSNGKIVKIAEKNLDWFYGEYPDAVEVGDIQQQSLMPSGDSGIPSWAKVAAPALLGFEQIPKAYNAFKNVFLGSDVYEEPEVKETDKEHPSYYGIKYSLSEVMGDNIITSFLAEEMSEMYRMGVSGKTQAGMTQPAWDIMSHLGESTPEEIDAIYKAHLASQKVEQTDAVKKYTARYEQIQEDYGGIMAFIIGVAENPEYIRDVSIQSLGNMITSAVTSEDVAGRAVAAGGVMAGIGSVVPFWERDLVLYLGLWGLFQALWMLGNLFLNFYRNN